MVRFAVVLLCDYIRSRTHRTRLFSDVRCFVLLCGALKYFICSKLPRNEMDRTGSTVRQWYSFNKSKHLLLFRENALDICEFCFSAFRGLFPCAGSFDHQVLMQTIEREPPSLKSYPDDRQPGGDVFGRNFKEVMRRLPLRLSPYILVVSLSLVAGFGC